MNLQINKKTYFNVVPLGNLLNITPFREQRPMNTKRLHKIINYYESILKSNKFTSFEMTTPMIFVKSNRLILLDNQNNRKTSCIVDGQHRLESLKKLQQKYPKIQNINIGIMVHIVKTVDKADMIQYNLFEQKPFNDSDKIKKGNYIIDHEIDKLFNKLRETNSKNIITNNNEKNYRRTHFHQENFNKSILNSPNIKKWIELKIYYKEILKNLYRIQTELYNEFKSLSIDDQFKFIGLKNTKISKLKKINKFTILTYKYYKNYNKLIEQLEILLNLVDDSDSESDSESDSDSN